MRLRKPTGPSSWAPLKSAESRSERREASVPRRPSAVDAWTAANEAEWTAIVERHPDHVEQVQRDLVDIAEGRLTWVEALQIPDEVLLGMAQAASVRVDSGNHAPAERTFRVLTLLDPYVPWFWLALGDVRRLQGKPGEACQAYARCIDEGLLCDPPAAEVATASLRKGTLEAQAGRYEAAHADLARAVEHDPSGNDGKLARLAMEHLVETGKLPAGEKRPGAGPGW